jgi:hypothetical protein
MEGLTGSKACSYLIFCYQSNGCKKVKIQYSEVGPSARNIPVLATFSNSRFIQFFTERLIPFGFDKEPEEMKDQLLALFQDSITFGDRPDAPMMLQEVFERNSKAVDLFRMYYLGDDLSALSEEDNDILDKAKLLFANRSGLTDGSVQYGILINRRGLPTTVGLGECTRSAITLLVSHISLCNPLGKFRTTTLLGLGENPKILKSRMSRSMVFMPTRLKCPRS